MNKRIAFVFACLCMALLLTASCESSVNRVMSEMAADFNKRCPMMITDSLRIDNMKALPGKRVQCNYTLFSTIKLDAQSKEKIETSLIQTIKNEPGMEFYRKNKATFEYNYNDRNGNLLFSIEIKPDKYE